MFAFVERVTAAAVESIMPPKESTPKGSTRLARLLRDDVAAITRGVPLRWVMVHELGLRHADAGEAAVDAAIARAIDKGWMTGGGTPPHSVCLTDEGRKLALPR